MKSTDPADYQPANITFDLLPQRVDALFNCRQSCPQVAQIAVVDDLPEPLQRRRDGSRGLQARVGIGLCVLERCFELP